MKRFLAILLSAMLAAPLASAQGIARNLHPAVEWGYSLHFYTSHHYNMDNSEGNRISGGESGFTYRSNARVIAGLCFNLSEKVSAGVFSGFLGVSEKTRMVPVLLRFTGYANGTAAGGMFAYIQGGPGFKTNYNAVRKTAWIADLGAGYRMPLSPDISMDLMMSIQGTADHPLIPNPDGIGYVSERSIRKNDARYYALNIKIGLNF